jgi:hypothetical protein
MKKQWLAVFQILLVLAAFAGSVYVAFTPANSLMRWYNIDDAFYYYKVAQNILTGNGISFDGINLSPMDFTPCGCWSAWWYFRLPNLD